jgi:hypothetical protein
MVEKIFYKDQENIFPVSLYIVSLRRTLDRQYRFYIPRKYATSLGFVPNSPSERVWIFWLRGSQKTLLAPDDNGQTIDLFGGDAVNVAPLTIANGASIRAAIPATHRRFLKPDSDIDIDIYSDFIAIMPAPAS